MEYSKQTAAELLNSRQYEKYVDYLIEYAEQGDSDAQYMLGHIYRQGEIVENDMEKAIRCSRFAWILV